MDPRFFSSLAEYKREKIVRRANDGRAAAKKSGTKLGQNPKLTKYQQDLVRQRLSKFDREIIGINASEEIFLV